MVDVGTHAPVGNPAGQWHKKHHSMDEIPPLKMDELGDFNCWRAHPIRLAHSFSSQCKFEALTQCESKEWALNIAADHSFSN